jgi:hypothetical protein
MVSEQRLSAEKKPAQRQSRYGTLLHQFPLRSKMGENCQPI